MILEFVVTSALVSFRRTDHEAGGLARSMTVLLHPLSLLPLLLLHLAESPSLSLATQLALGDEPALFAVGAEDFVLGHQPAEPLE